MTLRREVVFRALPGAVKNQSRTILLTTLLGSLMALGVCYALLNSELGRWIAWLLSSIVIAYPVVAALLLPRNLKRSMIVEVGIDEEGLTMRSTTRLIARYEWSTEIRVFENRKEINVSTSRYPTPSKITRKSFTPEDYEAIREHLKRLSDLEG